MSDKKCSICGFHHNLFLLEIPIYDGEGIQFTTEVKHICGSCFNIITEISKRSIIDKLQEMIDEAIDNHNEAFVSHKF